MSYDKSAGNRILDARRDEAIAWHVRLRSDALRIDDLSDFESWISDAANRAAFDEVDALDGGISDNAAAVRAACNQAEAGRSAQRWPQASVRRVWVVAGLAIAAVALVAVVMPPQPAPPAWSAFAAPADKPRQVALEDGSSVYLNRGATIRVAVDRHSRQVELATGEASFNVAHDVARPFSVEVGEDRIVDVGTEFNVLRLDGRTVVTVRQGAVAVSSRGDASGPSIRLEAGDHYVHARGAAPVVFRQTNANLAFAWQTGHLIYSDATLAQVVEDLNRYFDRPVRIEDEKAAALRFSGVVAIDSEDRVLERLRGLLPIDVSASEKEVVLRHKRER